MREHAMKSANGISNVAPAAIQLARRHGSGARSALIRRSIDVPAIPTASCRRRAASDARSTSADV